MKSTLSFLQPLQSVNDSQSLNHPVQVGAWADEASVGNGGVQVEILTNTYNVSSPGEDAFWVGDVLSDGGFIQFGYLILSPGYYCLNAHITENGTLCSGSASVVGILDTRWFWAYFPNMQVVNDWYYGFGPQDSVGTNATWHLYSIVPGISDDWSFVLDGLTVYSSDFPSAPSSSPAHLVAEKASGPYLSPLGPAEFRGLAYLANDSLWHAASSLTLIDGCGSADSSPCTLSSEYGVESAGADDIIAGSIVSPSNPSQLIWQRNSVCSLDAKLVSLGSVGSAPLNVTFTDSVSSPQGSFRIDWWFGDGSHDFGSSSQTVTYRVPGNYTPFVRVLDSAGCLSEASGRVTVVPTSTSTLGTTNVAAFSFETWVIASRGVTPRNTYAPWK
jgi:PKD domain